MNKNKNKNTDKNNNKKYNIKKYMSQYDIGFNKFKKDYINAYREKKFNFSKYKKYFNKNEYLKIFDNKSFIKMLSVEEKINNMVNSVRKTGKIVGKNTYKIIHKKDNKKKIK